MLSFFRYRRTEAYQGFHGSHSLSSARDDTIAALLIFEQQKGDVLPGDDILVLEWWVELSRPFLRVLTGLLCTMFSISLIA